MVNNDEIIKELKQSVANLESLLSEVYDAVVGKIDGTVGIQTQVRECSAEIIVIKEKIRELQKITDEIRQRDLKIFSDELTAIKTKVNATDEIIKDLKPESEDTRRKKLMVKGGLLVVIGLWTLIKLIVPLIISGFKFLTENL